MLTLDESLSPLGIRGPDRVIVQVWSFEGGSRRECWFGLDAPGDGLVPVELFLELPGVRFVVESLLPGGLLKHGVLIHGFLVNGFLVHGGWRLLLEWLGQLIDLNFFALSLLGPYRNGGTMRTYSR